MEIALFKNKPLYVNPHYAPRFGAFAGFTYSKKENRAEVKDGWHGCREEFLWYSFNKTTPKKFLFSHIDGRYKSIRDFITECEDRLGLPREHRCNILATSNIGVSIVLPSAWWSCISMRRALLTILLRCGQYFANGMTWVKALRSENYINVTQFATDRFFEGYTLYNGSSFKGWVNTFYTQGRSKNYKEQIVKMLVKSLDKPPKSAIIIPLKPHLYKNTRKKTTMEQQNENAVANGEKPLQAQAEPVAEKATPHVFKYVYTSPYTKTQKANAFCLFSPKDSDTIKESGSWYTCRESFSKIFTPTTPAFLFSVTNNEETKMVTNFIAEIESRLKLETRTSIMLTDLNNVIVVMLSPWWRTNLAKRQLFTILLRCGRIYNGKNFQQAVESQQYLRDTQIAFNYFMEGNHFVKPGGNTKIKEAGGWYNYFHGIDSTSTKLKWLVNE